jgi:hypothetical protein
MVATPEGFCMSLPVDERTIFGQPRPIQVVG